MKKLRKNYIKKKISYLTEQKNFGLFSWSNLDAKKQHKLEQNMKILKLPAYALTQSFTKSIKGGNIGLIENKISFEEILHIQNKFYGIYYKKKWYPKTLTKNTSNLNYKFLQLCLYLKKKKGDLL